MAQQRIKGQEVSILVISDSALEAELNDIQNFNITVELELLEQGYLGETANRYDEILKGCKFDFEMHEHSRDVLAFQQKIIDRATRKSPDLIFNVVCTLNFPNGQTPVVTLPDCHFGGQPRQIGGRGEYSKVKVEGAVSRPDIQTT